MNNHENDESPHFGRAVFNALPLPAFIVDDDVRILAYNAAAEKLLGVAPKSSLRRRGGEVLHCLCAGPLGCGQAKPCKNCIIRNSVKDAISGRNTRRKFYELSLRGSRGVTPVSLLVTANLLPESQPPQVLLILENMAETAQLYRRHCLG